MECSLALDGFHSGHVAQGGHLLGLDRAGDDARLAHFLLDEESHIGSSPDYLIEALGIDGQDDANGFRLLTGVRSRVPVLGSHRLTLASRRLNES